MNSDILISAGTAFIISAGGAFTAACFGAKGKPETWVIGVCCVFGAISAAKDVRSLKKLPPITDSPEAKNETKP